MLGFAPSFGGLCRRGRDVESDLVPFVVRFATALLICGCSSSLGRGSPYLQQVLLERLCRRLHGLDGGFAELVVAAGPACLRHAVDGAASRQAVCGFKWAAPGGGIYRCVEHVLEQANVCWPLCVLLLSHEAQAFGSILPNAFDLRITCGMVCEGSRYPVAESTGQLLDCAAHKLLRVIAVNLQRASIAEDYPMQQAGSRNG